MLKDVIYYILQKHGDSYNARVTKLVYLSDWKACLDYKNQITSINWYFDNYGPFVRDIENEILANSELFETHEEYNILGSRKKIFSVVPGYNPKLENKIISVIDFVIELTQDLDFNEFIKFIYSTYPIYKSRKFTLLNLVQLAKEYKQIR